MQSESPRRRHNASPDEGTSLPPDVWQLPEFPPGELQENFISHRGHVRSAEQMLGRHHLLFNFTCSNAFKCITFATSLQRSGREEERGDENRMYPGAGGATALFFFQRISEITMLLELESRR